MCIRNWSALALNCWVINRGSDISCKVDFITNAKRERYIYLQLSDRLVYYFTIHALELIYFDSNTQEKKKKHLFPSDSSNFPPLHWRIPQIFSTVTHTFTCFAYVYLRTIYILAVFAEKPHCKPLERNVVCIPIITLSHATSHDFNWRQNKPWLSTIWLDVGDIIRSSFTLHATQCSLHFNKPQKNEIHSLKEFHFSNVYRNKNYTGSRAKWMNPKGVHVNLASDPV